MILRARSIACRSIAITTIVPDTSGVHRLIVDVVVGGLRRCSVVVGFEGGVVEVNRLWWSFVRVGIYGLRYGLTKTLRKIRLLNLSCTTTVSPSIEMQRYGPSHDLVVVRYTRTRDPGDSSFRIFDASLPFGPEGCFDANASRLFACSATAARLASSIACCLRI